MKVLHVYRTYFPDPPGGLQEAIRQIAVSTKRLGVQSRIFTLSDRSTPSRLLIDDVEVIRGHCWAEIASCNLGGWGAIDLFRQGVKETDIVHYHFPWPFADLLSLFVPPSVVQVMTYHSDIVRQRALAAIYQPIQQRMLKKMDAVVATSEAYKRTSDVLQSLARVRPVHVIPLGMDDLSQAGEREAEHAIEHDDTVFRRLGLSPTEPYFLFIGALRYYKGLDYLLEAAHGLNAKVVIAGIGAQQADLESTVRRLRLDNVIFAGLITDVEKCALLKHCLALVLPSHLRSEAFGMTLIEASMFAKPMVTCEIGTGTTFVNRDHETGLVVPAKSPVALRQALDTLLASPDLRTELGAGARQRYEQLFNGEAIGAAYMDLYRSCLL